MILDPLTSTAAGSGRSPPANGLSRRKFLQAGAAAGGGLLLSLRLPFATGEAVGGFGIAGCERQTQTASRPTPSSASGAMDRLS